MKPLRRIWWQQDGFFYLLSQREQRTCQFAMFPAASSKRENKGHQTGISDRCEDGDWNLSIISSSALWHNLQPWWLVPRRGHQVGGQQVPRKVKRNYPDSRLLHEQAISFSPPWGYHIGFMTHEETLFDLKTRCLAFTWRLYLWMLHFLS